MTQNKAIKDIQSSLSSGNLIIVAGAGVSIALSDGHAPSWTKLIKHGFEFAHQRGSITPEQNSHWTSILNSNDVDELLSCAEFLSRKLGAPDGELYARWLQSEFEALRPTEKGLSKALRKVRDQGASVCTLNYDGLLEAILGQDSVTIDDKTALLSWMRHETNSVLHLHGRWQQPKSCILGIRDYQSTVGDDFRDLIQRALCSLKRLLFIGCGGTFSDPNFTALISWLRVNVGAGAPQHYALVRSPEVASRQKDKAWHGFVEPIGFGEDTPELASFLDSLAVQRQPRRRKEPSSTAASPTLNSYREFLIRDCGQMTVEGLRADMDTAQRKFDLEQLFVPLDVEPTPPEISPLDPERETKLAQWRIEQGEPKPFGKIFARHKRLALLALPGGGKTLLLKRLAVAYANPARRDSSTDALPALQVLPLLIRCREWREHIRTPILELIAKIPEITGQLDLKGLREAVLPSLAAGQVLLLVDGLDEIHNDADRETFVENLERFLERYPKIRLVVTSREAGFSLVAPCLMRFCDRYRISALNDDAIKLLCSHWHRLMSAGSLEGQREGEELAGVLRTNEALRRLAENPLLLTMLLVVKHGAGRLPPDRVSLYERAVEILLDTWNIKGHAPLNPKEAVPQLSFIAFQMMKEGKQTATERELLQLLDIAREKIPQVKRYAKDKPDEFLKRVELRSSLLLEGGRLAEGIRTVPFYQFRHLTFQEYLAAVAIVEGNYPEYRRDKSVLTPLSSFLVADEWKEVVPMTAVLARKQAEPLLAELVKRATKIRALMEQGRRFKGKEEWEQGEKQPSAISRLIQCLIEEAECTTETLSSAIDLIVLFAKGCRGSENWRALASSPFNEEILHRCWAYYEPMTWSWDSWLRNTFAMFSALSHSTEWWMSKDGQDKLMEWYSNRPELRSRALLTCCGLHWSHVVSRPRAGALGAFSAEFVEGVTASIHDAHPAVRHAAAWAYGLIARHGSNVVIKDQELSALLSYWAADKHDAVQDNIFGFAISAAAKVPRDHWAPKIDQNLKDTIHIYLEIDGKKQDRRTSIAFIAAYYGRLYDDKTLSEKLAALDRARPNYQFPEIDDAIFRDLAVKPVNRSTKLFRPS